MVMGDVKLGATKSCLPMEVRGCVFILFILDLGHHRTAETRRKGPAQVMYQEAMW